MHSFAVRQVVKESVHEQFDYIGKLDKSKTTDTRTDERRDYTFFFSEDRKLD